MRNRSALLLTAWVWSCTSFGGKITVRDNNGNSREIEVRENKPVRISREENEILYIEESGLFCCGLFEKTKGTACFKSITITYRLDHAPNNPYMSKILTINQINNLTQRNQTTAQELLVSLCDDACTKGIDVMTFEYTKETPPDILPLLRNCGFNKNINHEYGLYTKKILKAD